MSASSLWVTCGIVTQLRASARPADLLDPRERDPLDLAVLLEVDLRPRRDLEPGARRPARRARLSLRRLLDVVLRDPALAARPLTPAPDPPRARAPGGGPTGSRRPVRPRSTGGRRAAGSPLRAARSRRRRAGCGVSRSASRLRLPSPTPSPAPRRAAASSVAIATFDGHQHRCPRRPCRPTLTRISATLPANGAGTSIVALSDSSVTSGCVLGRPRRPGRDQDLDHGDVGEVADVGDRDFARLGHQETAGSGRVRVDLVRARSRPATTDAVTSPSAASAESAATATWWRSTSKNRRRCLR